MTTISASRRIGRAGVNALRTLLEEHDHLVQEIGEGADHGEDLYVGFVSGDRRTGHVVAVQVKSGKKYKRAKGYAIPVADHRQDWQESRLPVVGVVYDRDQKRLFWVNLTQELQNQSGAAWIQVPRVNELTDGSLSSFVSELQTYIDTQGAHVAGEAEDVTWVADATGAAPVADSGQASLAFNKAVGAVGILVATAYVISMAAMFTVMAVPVLQATDGDAWFSIGSPLAAVLACLVASSMAKLDPGNLWAQVTRVAGVGIVWWIDYLVFSHYHPLNNLAIWLLLGMAILCETPAFVCTPQIVYRFAMAGRQYPG
ncbi:DUF4365 domain-containing protein [Kitasatospora sp. NPDC090308]|uniref:DUF4365 domain-containing protein n=1 Tax=Kitasatospora sp. NPDC090308 TaxID=3364082 RepID=UPI0038168CCB